MNPILSIARRATRVLTGRGLIGARRAACIYHRVHMGRWPRLKEPRDFNEKILWLEFNTDTSEWSRLADKYEVRTHAATKGLGDLLVPLYGLWDRVEDINLDELPEEFVMKATNGFGQTLLVTDKEAWKPDDIRRKINSWNKPRQRLAAAEPHYARIPFRIIAEQLLKEADGQQAGQPMAPADYKFFCMDGVPRYCEICTGRNFKNFMASYTFYSLPDWKREEDFVLPPYRGGNSVAPPRLRNEMYEYARILAKGFPFVRIDFYEVNNRVYLGEMTFTPGAGHLHILTPDALRTLGDLITLPTRNAGT